MFNVFDSEYLAVACEWCKDEKDEKWGKVTTPNYTRQLQSKKKIYETLLCGNVDQTLKCGPNIEMWTKHWNVDQTLKRRPNIEMWTKHWNVDQTLKCGPNKHRNWVINKQNNTIWFVICWCKWTELPWW